MTVLTKEGLKENLDALVRFAYFQHHEEWLKFCDKERKGKQDVEELNMLIRSITDDNPWRLILSMKSLERFMHEVLLHEEKVGKFFDDLMIKLRANEKVVDGES
jgi:hypothetical protein